MDLARSNITDSAVVGCGAVLPVNLPQGQCDLAPHAAALGFPAGTNLASGLAAAKRLLDARYLDHLRPGAGHGTIPGINWQALSRALQPNAGSLFDRPTLNIYHGTELRDLGVALAAARDHRWVTTEDSQKLDALVGRLAASRAGTPDRTLLASLHYQVAKGVGKGCLTSAESALLTAPVSYTGTSLPVRPGAALAQTVNLGDIGLGWNQDGILVLTDGKYRDNPLQGQSTHFLRSRLDSLAPESSAADAVACRIFTRALAATKLREQKRPNASQDAWDSLLADLRREFPR